MMHVIEQAIVDPKQYCLRLIYRGGEAVCVDCEPLIRRGGVFAALADRNIFQQVSVGEAGRFIEWPGGIDLCADALWLGQGRFHSEKRESSNAC
jgi:hypothetical protein